MALAWAVAAPAALAALLLRPAAAATGPQPFCVLAASAEVDADIGSCSAFRNESSRVDWADVHMAADEAEQRQILVEVPEGHVVLRESIRVSMSASPASKSGSPPLDLQHEWWQVGYVYGRKNERVPGSQDRWHPEVLVPPGVLKSESGAAGPADSAGAPGDNGTAPARSFVLLVRWRLASGAGAEPAGSPRDLAVTLRLGYELAGTPGSGGGLGNAGAAASSANVAPQRLDVPLRFTVYENVKLHDGGAQRGPVDPAAREEQPWVKLFNFNFVRNESAAQPEDAALATPRLTNATLFSWLSTFSQHGTPAVAYHGYSSAAQNLDVYDYLITQAGQRLVGLAGAPHGCSAADVTAEVLDAFRRKLTTELRALKRARPQWFGLGPDLPTFMVYGFDETAPSCEPAIRKIFGLVAAEFPELRTMSALNWVDPKTGKQSLPLDLPLDYLVTSFTKMDADFAKAWVNSDLGKKRGRRAINYHCVEPSGKGYLNAAIIDRPLLDSRLMYWSALAIPEVSGWLYWDVALYKTGCPGRPGAQMAPLSFRDGDRNAKTTGNAAQCVWWPQLPNIWVNGDGALAYPARAVLPGTGGVGGGVVPLLPSLRLAVQSDAWEDLALFRLPALGGPSYGQSKVRRVYRSATDFDRDAAAMELMRREALEEADRRLAAAALVVV